VKSSLLIATAFGAVPGAKHGRESRADALVDARAGGNVSVQAALGCNGFWLTVTFVISGLLAAPNGTLIATMLISALSASGAILLILEMYTPYGGLIQVSDAPLRAALAQLGQ